LQRIVVLELTVGREPIAELWEQLRHSIRGFLLRQPELLRELRELVSDSQGG